MSCLVLSFCLLFTCGCFIQEMLSDFLEYINWAILLLFTILYSFFVFSDFIHWCFFFTSLWYIVLEKNNFETLITKLIFIYIVIIIWVKLQSYRRSLEIFWYNFLFWLNTNYFLREWMRYSFFEYKTQTTLSVQVKFHSQEVWKFWILRSQSTALHIILVYPAFSRTMQWR